MGGLGPTSRQWGTTVDHVHEVEVVLADGTITRANENQNPDLFFVCDHCVWSFRLSLSYSSFPSQAIRGAGASFGIVTEFVFITHPEPGPTIRYSYTFKLVISISYSRWLSNLILCLQIGECSKLGQDLCQMAILHL